MASLKEQVKNEVGIAKNKAFRHLVERFDLERGDIDIVDEKRVSDILEEFVRENID